MFKNILCYTISYTQNAPYSRGVSHAQGSPFAAYIHVSILGLDYLGLHPGRNNINV
jgi:hypothetical protein